MPAGTRKPGDGRHKPPVNAWQRGQSGNPAGRKAEVGPIRDLARQHTQEAIAALVEIATNRQAAAVARVAAASALLDRGYGKPTQPISGDDEMPALRIIIDAVEENRSPDGG